MITKKVLIFLATLFLFTLLGTQKVPVSFACILDPNTGQCAVNYCLYATKGAGGYCGSVLGHGANANTVYTCSGTNGVTTKIQACATSCVINSYGSDYCASSTSGGGGSGGGTSSGGYNNSTSCTSLQGYCAVGDQTACGSNKYLYSGGWCGSGKVCCGPNTTTTTTNPAPSGAIDGVGCSSGGVAGWACQSNEPTTPLTVNFYVDSTSNPSIGNTSASSPREAAVGAQCGGNVNHGFSYTLPQSVFDGKQHTLIAQAQGSSSTTNLPSSGAPITFTCSASTTPPSPAPSSGPVIATINLALGLPGIGYNGNAPLHNKRTVTIELYGPSVTNPGGPGTKPLASTTGAYIYQTTGNTAGYFVPQSPLTIQLPSNPPANNQYQILVKMPQYLYKLAVNNTSSSTTTIFTISPNTTVTAPILYMDPGDLITANGGANLLNLDDYTQLKTCFGSSSSCPTTTDGIPVADLNDDGSVSIVDFNIMLRSLANFINNESSHCNGLECQGD